MKPGSLSLTHVIVAVADGAPSAETRSHLQSLLESVFFVCQQWIIKRVEVGDIHDATLTAVTRLGGQFGVETPVEDVAGGGLAGLFKNIAREFPELQVRVVDHASESHPSEIAHRLLPRYAPQVMSLKLGISR